MTLNTAQLSIENDHLAITWDFVPEGKKSKTEKYRFNDTITVRFIYPSWQKLSFIRNIFLFLLYFLLTSPGGSFSIPVKVEIIDKDTCSTFNLHFASFKDAKEIQQRINAALKEYHKRAAIAR